MIELKIRDCIKVNDQVYRLLYSFDPGHPIVLSPVLTEEIARLEDEHFEKKIAEFEQADHSYRPVIID